MINLFEEDAKQYAEFLEKNYPASRNWLDPVGCCKWYISNKFMLAAIGDDNKVVALCAARPVERAGFGVMPFHFDEHGDCLHIDLLVDTSNDERAIMAFRGLLLMRFGERKTVTIFRREEEQLRTYNFRKFWDSFLKLNRIKKETN